jgi:hypothetical protein
MIWPGVVFGKQIYRVRAMKGKGGRIRRMKRESANDCTRYRSCKNGMEIQVQADMKM